MGYYSALKRGSWHVRQRGWTLRTLSRVSPARERQALCDPTHAWDLTVGHAGAESRCGAGSGGGAREVVVKGTAPARQD